MSAVTPSTTAPDAPTAPGTNSLAQKPSTHGQLLVLRALMLAIGAGCLLEFWTLNAETETTRLLYPAFAPWLWNLYLFFHVLATFGLFIMWGWQKWGWWLSLAMAVGIVLIEWTVIGFSLYSLRVPLAVAALWFAVVPLRDRWLGTQV